MAIKSIKCHNFRNLTQNSLTFNPHLNIIYGKNGSGKSSLLEAIYIVSTGKSFRSNYLKYAIHHDEDNFILYSQFDFHTVGIKKDQSSFITKLNSKRINKRSILAKQQAALILDSNCFNLLNSSSKNRREFIDWALFHVEHNFSDLWIQYNKTIKQRNKLLKTKGIDQIKYWNDLIINTVDNIHPLRIALINKLQNIITTKSDSYSILKNVSIEYKQGWTKDHSFKEALEKKQNNDLKKGFTSVGVHLSDIKFFIKGKEIKEVFSRGQQKQFIILIQKIMFEYVSNNVSTKPIFIIDDLASELDQNSMNNVIVSLLEKDYQIFVSSINLDSSLHEIKNDKSVFHVEHGNISEIN